MVSRAVKYPAMLLILVGALAALVGAIGFPADKPQTNIIPTALVYPVMAPRMSSGYGMRIHPIRRFSAQHHGIDLAAPFNTPIRAVSSGRVVFADPYAGYGKYIVVAHGTRLTSHYGHCNSIKVQPGQVVKAGQIIGYVGSSGLSTGPHLHFEIRIDGGPQDPEKFIPGLADEAEG